MKIIYQCHRQLTDLLKSSRTGDIRIHAEDTINFGDDSKPLEDLDQ